VVVVVVVVVLVVFVVFLLPIFEHIGPVLPD
jgi:hypothetical protein